VRDPATSEGVLDRAETAHDLKAKYLSSEMHAMYKMFYTQRVMRHFMGSNLGVTKV